MDSFKDILEKSQRRLSDIADKLDDQREELSEDAAELWQQAKPKLGSLKESLTTAALSLQSQGEQARLQAHLAAMDAQDQWSYLSKTMTELTRNAQQKGRTELESAELQAHLAKMDARDFVNQQGEALSKDYQQAREKIEQASHTAMKELERSLEIIGKSWSNF
ncbi:hypothetical protein SIN8267_02666 [Sinobacterium norvegicum]|uniref:Uncharacterized protein n=2 Tax=Sinobacterium norvegicum TaxID=1641715 RepID=A0ABM9AH44_9GAMM|nr:hypothetical protein SIN8267_02666 [Sinobacterium norvegicum]